MADDANEGSAAMLGSVATEWSKELVSVVADYRIEWRQPQGRQDALELLMRSTGGGGGMGCGDHGPYSVTPVGKPRLPQPALTDAERKAVGRAIATLDGWQQTGGYHSAVDDDAATLRGLLERTK